MTYFYRYIARKISVLGVFIYAQRESFSRASSTTPSESFVSVPYSVFGSGRPDSNGRSLPPQGSALDQAGPRPDSFDCKSPSENNQGTSASEESEL